MKGVTRWQQVAKLEPGEAEVPSSEDERGQCRMRAMWAGSNRYQSGSGRGQCDLVVEEVAWRLVNVALC